MNRQQASDNIKLVFNSYQELLNKSYSLIDEAQIERIVKILTEKKGEFMYMEKAAPVQLEQR